MDLSIGVQLQKALGKKQYYKVSVNIYNDLIKIIFSF